MTAFTGSAIWSSLLVIVLIAIAHMALRWYTRRRCLPRTNAPVKEQGLEPVPGTKEHRWRGWLRDTMMTLIGPLALVLWVQGLHYALAMLLGEITHPAVARYGLPALDLLRGIATILALLWLLRRIGHSIETWLVDLSRRSHSRSDDFFLPIAGTAIRLLLPLLAIVLGSSMLAVPPRLEVFFSNALSMILVGALGYVLYRLVDAACDLLLERYRTDVADNREARAIHTQVTVLRKVAIATIILFSFAAMLMVFDQVRQIGMTILASAGVAGIVIGFAAQRSLGMLLAGFQIAMTQPIRLDDAVLVEGEWGRIEEITLTYVVVNLWDQRRLVVPMTYFLEKPFQNWTRTTTELLGTVELYVDYGVPMDALREKLTSILTASRHWDKRVNALQVTDVREHTVQIRALVSASNAGEAFDLRCEVREGLVRFLQDQHAGSLPRLRLSRAQSRVQQEAQSRGLAG